MKDQDNVQRRIEEYKTKFFSEEISRKEAKAKKEAEEAKERGLRHQETLLEAQKRYSPVVKEISALMNDSELEELLFELWRRFATKKVVSIRGLFGGKGEPKEVPVEFSLDRRQPKVVEGMYN